MANATEANCPKPEDGEMSANDIESIEGLSSDTHDDGAEIFDSRQDDNAKENGDGQPENGDTGVNTRIKFFNSISVQPKKEFEPPQDQSGQSQDQTEPPQEQSGQSQDQSEPPQKQSGQSQDQFELPQEQSGPSPDQSQPPQEQTGKSQDQSEPPLEQSGKSQDQSEPPQEQTGQSQDQSEPPLEQYGQSPENLPLINISQNNEEQETVEIETHNDVRYTKLCNSMRTMRIINIILIVIIFILTAAMIAVIVHFTSKEQSCINDKGCQHIPSPQMLKCNGIKNIDRVLKIEIWEEKLKMVVQLPTNFLLHKIKYDEREIVMCRKKKKYYYISCNKPYNDNCTIIYESAKNTSITTIQEAGDRMLTYEIPTKCIDKRAGLEWILPQKCRSPKPKI
ncbi:uncharacterized protein LOC127729648 [Mytilus californianus]|uniref:uncharacterized protein LOC127729648 n=1 Tax=Mytilus californianus TaxID=6549 RepID=UPI002247BF48|nr:uncharacterized protein LOC127729648 [Mytilus californianus]